MYRDVSLDAERFVCSFSITLVKQDRSWLTMLNCQGNHKIYEANSTIPAVALCSPMIIVSLPSVQQSITLKNNGFILCFVGGTMYDKISKYINFLVGRFFVAQNILWVVVSEHSKS